MLSRSLIGVGAGSLAVAAMLWGQPAAVAAPPEVEAGGCPTKKGAFCIGLEGEERFPGKERESGGGSASKVQCKLTKVDPPPSRQHPIWKEAGADKKKGDVYFRACIGAPDNEDFDGFIFVADGEPAPQVDPVVLAYRAVDEMALRGPRVASPTADGKYVVGMPMWMWVTPSATTYGPNSASASAGGVTVTATAEVSKMVWEMGDGKTVTCTKPGTPYKKSYGKRESPDCGHLYTQPSTGDGYPVTVTATWDIAWEGGGEEGELTTTRTAQTQVTVAELQVVN